MAGHQELQSFVNKFVNLWKSGFEAKLNVEAQAGQACVSIQLGLGTLHQPPYFRRPAPSRLRRRARRAEDRAAQAQAAAQADLPPANADVAVEAANADAAVEAAVPIPPTAEAAVQAVPNPPCTVEAAVQATPDLPQRDHGSTPHHAQAEPENPL